MSSWRDAIAVALCVGATGALAQSSSVAGIGRPATAQEVAAWDIDVRPDLKGLPPGAGSVVRGQVVWEAQCASCHGVFGESNQVFAPIVGGTTADDVKTGRVARLADPAYPQRTTMMKVSQVSTLWDTIRRSMPWNAPKSLSVDDVYAVTAYVLHLGGVVGQDFVLDDRNMAQVQSRTPNRHGMTRDHAMWPGAGAGFARTAPDVLASACMRDCGPPPVIASSLPDHARGSHGNLAEQNRTVGPQRGVPTGAASPAARVAAPAAAPTDGRAILALAAHNTCTACHAMQGPLVGPSFRDIAGKYANQGEAILPLAAKIQAGGAGVWGAIPMPPQAIADADARAIAQWLIEGARP